MFGRDGNLSIIRVGTLAAIVGVLFIIGAIVFFFIDRGSHQVPLEIEPFPGAANSGVITRSSTSQTEYFQITTASPEDVVAYYQGKMDGFYDAGTEKELRECKRRRVVKVSRVEDHAWPLAHIAHQRVTINIRA